MELYGAVVTTTPFLLVALLVELRAFGPAAGRSKRIERRRDRKTDLQVLLFLAVGFTAALIGLMTKVDHWALRLLAGGALGIGALIIFVVMWRDIERLYGRSGD